MGIYPADILEVFTNVHRSTFAYYTTLHTAINNGKKYGPSTSQACNGVHIWCGPSRTYILMLQLPDHASERAPLLPDSQRDQENGAHTNGNDAPSKKAARWVVRNAVMIFMSLLILAAIIVLCVFLGSM